MRRIILGTTLLLHSLAHANAGMLASHPFRVTPTILWAVATVGFLAAGFGLLGVRQLRRHWQVLALAAIFASLILLIAYRPATAWYGIAIDLALLGVLGFVSVYPPAWNRRGGRLATIGGTLALAFLVYVAVAIITRPWHSRWGSTAAELRASLPGDELVPSAHYIVQHAVTIRASAAEIWPWLVQLGQDRGGFYSYAWLERAIGDDITNADRIHPEWQMLREGDLVRAAQPDYLGGVFGADLGWRILRLEPERVLALGGWGVFVLDPADDGSTRLIVRTRGDAKPNVALAPFGLLVFEPAHFIMERAMLRGIKRRVEGDARRTAALPM
jgi:hypothetical protein